MKTNRASKHLICLVSIVFLLSISSAFADVRLPALMGDNMVLQRYIEIPIWGTAEPSEGVTVQLGMQRVFTSADEQGRWMVWLKPMEAGGPYEMTVTGNNELVVNNILIGDVWICSGQSNMQWPVRASDNGEREVASSYNPSIRLFGVRNKVSDRPMEEAEGKWDVCSPDTVPNFSAVGYFFGRDLQKTLDVPIGLINSSWGGTPAESWTTRETLELNSDYTPIFERWGQYLTQYPGSVDKYQAQLAQWERDVQKAKDEGTPEPNKPYPPTPPENNPWMPASLYNAMIHPLIPYGLKGAIWYQGESNAGRAYQYRDLFPAMIKDWRRMWGQSDLSFFFVQLANFLEMKPEPDESAWAELREAQLMTLSLPNTGMAVIIDIGEANNIHPTNKQDVGYRLALNALAVAYGLDIDYSGPIYKEFDIEGDRIRLHFDHVDGGLVAKDADRLKGFAIAGRDKKFVWADAEIEGDTVIVWSEKVLEPIAVRYAWADNPDCNLYNKADLPASPFRTDAWHGTTYDKK